MERILYFLKGKTDGAKAFYLLGPTIFFWLLVWGFPLLSGVLLSFFHWVGAASAPRFNGIGNYVRFFSEPVYYLALWRSVWIGLLATTITVVGGFAAALLMNMPLKGNGLYRVLWYVPAVASVAATTQVINIFIDPISGILNRLLRDWFDVPAVAWQFSLFWSVAFIVLYSVWKGIGYTALIWLAGLKSIDPTLYEAASIDGAGRTNKFWHITLPGLKPIATFIIITGIIGAVQIYEQVLFITNGGPLGQTEVLVTRILKDTFYGFNLGMASTSSVVLAATILVFVVVYFRMTVDSTRSSRRWKARGTHE